MEFAQNNDAQNNQTLAVSGGKDIISIDEYRRLTGDQKSSDEKIAQRISFLGAFCRNIIKIEMKEYVEKNQTKK